MPYGQQEILSGESSWARLSSSKGWKSANWRKNQDMNGHLPDRFGRTYSIIHCSNCFFINSCLTFPVTIFKVQGPELSHARTAFHSNSSLQSLLCSDLLSHFHLTRLRCKIKGMLIYLPPEQSFSCSLSKQMFILDLKCLSYA